VPLTLLACLVYTQVNPIPTSDNFGLEYKVPLPEKKYRKYLENDHLFGKKVPFNLFIDLKIDHPSNHTIPGTPPPQKKIW
jgi:hypothetical protein